MERMGHSSPRAALIYQHATRERDQKIAAGTGRLFAEARKTSTSKSGSTPKPSARNEHDARSAHLRSTDKSSEEFLWPGLR
jgi:hypothetical protein